MADCIKAANTERYNVEPFHSSNQSYPLTDNLFAMFVAQPRDVSRDGRRLCAIGAFGSFAAQGAQLAKGKTSQHEQEH